MKSGRHLWWPVSIAVGLVDLRLTGAVYSLNATHWFLLRILLCEVFCRLSWHGHRLQPSAVGWFTFRQLVNYFYLYHCIQRHDHLNIVTKCVMFWVHRRTIMEASEAEAAASGPAAPWGPWRGKQGVDFNDVIDIFANLKHVKLFSELQIYVWVCLIYLISSSNNLSCS